MSEPPILEIRDIRKHFGGVRALDGVSFAIAAGEVHAIVGENGAGKSTMMNVLAGVYPADSGAIFLRGQPYAPADPREAREKGISIVFQELALFPTFTVEGNIFAGKEMTQGLRLDHRAMQERATATISQMLVELDVSEQLGLLTIGQQQWVEIARALTDDAQVLILDEPNSALNQYETQALFRLIRRLKEQGITVIYISHRLEEVFQIADRITVLRDGHYIGTWRPEETTTSAIVAAMVGREIRELFDRRPAPPGEVVLEVADLAIGGRLKPISFTVRAGEVVGFAGLAGAGVSDLFEALFGVQQATQGQVRLKGQVVSVTTPSRAMEHEAAMVPADRRGLGLMMNWSVLENITIGVLPRLARLGVIHHERARRTAQSYVERLRIVTESLDKGILYLSGGNQQKTLLARWLATEPRLLILEDPTRGIDVGAKQEIYALIDRIAAEGVAVLFTSSEMEEILSLCDRIVVLRRGEQVAELPRQVADKELITEFAAGDLKAAQALLRSRQGAVTTTPTAQAEAEAGARQAAGTAEGPALPRSKAGPDNRLGRLLRRVFSIREFGVFQALLAVVVFFALLTPHFLTASNLLLITRQMSILAVIAAGMTFVLASGEVDLSVGWIFNMVMSAMAAVTVSLGVDPWLAVPVGLLLGAALGAFNGLVAVALELPTIIVTLGTLTLYRGLALAINNGRTIGGLPESSFFEIGAGSLGSVSHMTLVMLVVFAITAWILRNTRFARHLLAMGSNTQAAERIGVRTRRLRVLVMTFSGLLCGVAGVLGLSFLGAADPQSGSGYELVAIAAAIIGGAQLGGGSGTIWGSLIGIALIMTIQNGLVLLGLRPAWQIASTGLIIIAAVTLDYLTRARRRRAAEELKLMAGQG